MLLIKQCWGGKSSVCLFLLNQVELGEWMELVERADGRKLSISKKGF